MATVPKIGDEMNSYSNNENDVLLEVNGPKHMKCYFQELDLCSPGDRIIQLKISHKYSRKDFKQVVSVIVAMERLKTILVSGSQQPSATTLLSIIFEEESINLYDIIDQDAAVQSRNCILRDINQKCLVLSGPCELKALHLNGENIKQQVVFSMIFVQGEISQEKIPVALALRRNNLYLSCVMIDGKPTLQLETLDPKVYPKKKMESRFVFNKLQVKDKMEFESSAFPNWFISTSQMEEQPVFLGNTRGGQDITDFTVEETSS
ncbi:PREDICTED: interleukin-1 beta [Chrysochloris asiatica]|uniref:Multifunctional fusion protein n=1 Tax=Chrysochloris asiatica TaxID=185453 RepID=A0A9B0U3T9_CHRAS|nr:PREDICTED: interleukin-1 beta [Chrysochloris asiatica]